MVREIDFVFKYLKKVKIKIDEEEFLFQFKSHPDYSSLLAISDTLNFFNINNGALRVPSSNIEMMPDYFVAGLKTDDFSYFSLVEKKEFTYECTSHKGVEYKINLSLSELKEQWDGFILLIENEERYQTKNIETSKSVSNNYLFIILLFVTVVFFSYNNIKLFLFYLFPLSGIFLSIAALKDLFNTKFNLISKICDFGSNMDCDSIVNSKHWKIFEKLRLSDLSFVFFTVQFMTLLVFSFYSSQDLFFNLQLIILVFTLPIIPVSIYYQKFVAKKWCTICLLIISILLLEITYIIVIRSGFYLTFSPRTLVVFSLLFVTFFFLWSKLRILVEKLNDLKLVEIEANRFKRNYSIFKNSLVVNKIQTKPSLELIKDIDKKKLHIVFITSPYCKYCLNHYEVVKKIKKKYANLIRLDIFFKTNFDKEKSKKIFQNFMEIFQTCDINYFFLAMDSWYEDKNIEKWLEKYEQYNLDIEKVDGMIIKQNTWCNENNLNFTPCILIEGYLFPTEFYNIEDLIFLIDELLEDQI